MVGLFPPDDPSPLGRAMSAAFERVPALLAFRTTNKVGAVVVLATTVALAVGWRTWQARTRTRSVRLRAAGVVLASLVLVGASAPLWNGDLYPLGYTIPETWHEATDDLDAGDPAARVLALPGGTGGNYRWGMRSPDDLFPSLLDRPVAVRNTVVARGEPAANFLSTFDTQLAQGALAPGAIAATARLLGASDVLVRNDLLVEEIGGPDPVEVVRQASADPDLLEVARYGTPGTDTLPGRSGPATRADRAADPRNAAIPPLIRYEVADPVPVVRAAPTSSQVLVVGDGDAIPALAAAGLVDGTQPLRFLADLDDESFARAVADGGRVVLTDTNRRRAWDVNRTANATSATLAADDDIDAGDGATVTRWPDAPDDQTVSVVPGGARVGADRPGFGLHPFGRPSNAFDGDPSTAWLTGGFQTARGSSVWIELPEARRIEQIAITPFPSQPSVATAVRVRVGDKQVIESFPVPGEPVVVGIEPSTARRVEVTLLAQTSGSNPVGLSEISIDGTTITDVARAPRTLERLAGAADPATSERLAALPFDVVLTRARGAVADPGDDEEAQLDRRFHLPHDRTFQLTAEVAVAGTDEAAIDEARRGEASCRPVAVLDGEPVEAIITSSREELARGRARLEGCQPLRLDAGLHELRTIFGWRLDLVHLASASRDAGSDEEPGALDSSAGGVEVVSRSATRLELEVPASSEGHRYLRIGEAFDERWSLELDGRDAGPPIVVDGYATGWRIDGDAHRAVVTFGPQRAVEGTFMASALALVGITAVALLPAPASLRRRRSDA
jgi:arabinofuranan 3-O-arabinosyltransferase